MMMIPMGCMVETMMSSMKSIVELPSTSISHHITFGRIYDGYSYSHMYEEEIRTYSSRSKMEKVR